MTTAEQARKIATLYKMKIGYNVQDSSLFRGIEIERR